MKKLILLASVSFVLHTSLYAQTTPRVLSYQGVIRSVSNVAGNHSMIVTLYGDANGTIKLWQETLNTPVDSSGVFNCLLGTSDNPLPSSTVMDQPLWLGVAIDSSNELRPLSEVTASAYAINVADQSISTNKLIDNAVTTNKLADSSVTTSKLSNQSVSTDKLVDSSITASKMGTNYVSSISVNGTQVTGNGTAINIAGANGINLSFDPISNSLYFSAGAGAPSGNGGFQTLSTGKVVAFYDNSILNYVPGTPTDSTNWVLHGDGGVAPTWSRVNLTTDVSGILANAKGGTGGTPVWSTTVAAGGNTATDYSSTVSGGAAGLAENFAATVSGGYYNASYGDDGVVAGGEGNTVGVDSADPASYHSAISGGANNSIRGANSAIAGGTSLLLGPFSFGFNGDNDTGSVTVRGDPVPRVAALTILSDTLGGPNLKQVAYFGNVNMMIGNVDGTARELQFYSPNTSYVYSGSKYTSFQAGGQTANIYYTLPTTAPDSLGWVLGISGASGPNIDLQWQRMDTGSGAGGIPAWYQMGNTSVPPPTHFLGTIDSETFEIHIHNAATSTGGNQRVMQYSEGSSSPNLLGGSSANTLGTGLSGAAILSGGSLANPNTNSAVFSVVAGGEGNGIDSLSEYCDIGGGRYNTISSSYESTILGGYGNLMVSANGVIGSGFGNTIYNGISNGILGGDSNYLYGSYSAMLGGYDNRINNANLSAIGGGQSNLIFNGSTSISPAEYMTIPGGIGLIAKSYAQTVVGDYNIAQGTSGGLSPLEGQVLGDRLFIVGAGFDSVIIPTDSLPQYDTLIRFNAFEVSNNGHSIVYHTNGSGGATPGGLAPPVPGSAAIYAARCQDNTPIAWGDIAGIDSTSPSLRGRDTVFADYGVASVQYIATGEYLLTLNTVDSYTGTTISTFQDISVVATTRALGPFGPQCRLVQVTQAAEGSNQFYLWIQDLSCDLKNARVDFQVFARR